MSTRPPKYSAHAASLAGDYLTDAVNELDAMANPEALYGTSPYDESSESRPLYDAMGRAIDERLRRGRNAVLFAAFAAEAYINEFSVAMLSRADRDALDRRLSPPMRYLVLPKYALGDPLFSRDDDIMPGIFKVFALRNDLAHPRPGFAPRRDRHASPFVSAARGREFASRLAIGDIADYVLAVAKAALLLNAAVYGDDSWLDPPDWIVRGERGLIHYAQRHDAVPAIDEPRSSVWGLMAAVLRAERGDEAE